jgi:5-methylcytosine-specific restriction endonuclease McrA
LEAAFAQGREPEVAPNGRVRIRTAAGGYLTLAIGAELTNAGRYWYGTLAPGRAPRLGDLQAEQDARGREWLNLNGRRRLLRRIGADGPVLTKLGRAYYADREIQYVVSIPGIVRRRKADGSYTAGIEVPVPHTAIFPRILTRPASMSEEQRLAEIKLELLERIYEGSRTGDDRPILVWDSDPIVYDEYGQWEYAEETTRIVDGHAAVEAAVNRPLGRVPFLPGRFLHPWGLCPEALEDSGRCVVVQLTRLLGVQSEGELEDMLKETAPTYVNEVTGDLVEWQADLGVTAAHVAALAGRLGRTVHVMLGGRKAQVFQPVCRDHHVKSLYMAVVGDHAMFYEHPEACERLRKLFCREAPQRLADEDPEDERRAKERRLYSETKPWEGLPTKGGTYVTENIKDVRLELLRRGISPCVHLSGRHEIKSLSLPELRRNQRIRVVAVPPEAEFLHRFAEALKDLVDEPYCCESTSAYMNRVVVALLRRRERNAEAEAATRSAGECAHCGAPGAEVHHKAPVSGGGGSRADNLVLLCRDCHLAVTLSQNMAPREGNPLQSVFEPWVYKIFHESNKPKQLVMKLDEPKRGEPLELDVKGCRRNALLKNTEPLPLYSPLDVPKPAVEGRLAPYSFVDIGTPRTREQFLRSLPYRGAGWYWIGAVKHMLHRGVIAWPDIKLSLWPTAQLEADVLPRLLGQLEAVWTRLSGAPEWKHAVNGWLGLLGAPKRLCYEVETVQRSDDATLSGKVQRRAVVYGEGPEEVVLDFVQEVELKSWRSTRPVHQVVLDMEHCFVADALELVRSLPGTVRLNMILVDGLWLQANKLQQRALKDRLGDKFSLKKPKDPRGRYHVVGDFALPVSEDPVPEVPAVRWRRWTERRGLTAERAMVQLVVRKGRSAACLGLGGTGKSAIIRRLQSMLPDCVVLAPTNVQARNVGGITVHRFLHRFVSYKGVIIVDEVGQLPLPLWAALLKYVHCGARFVLCGDFKTQFAPAYDGWRTRAGVKPVSQRSVLFWRLAGGNLVKATVNRRFDPEHFQRYKAYRRMPLDLALADARVRYPCVGEPDWHLVVSHALRRRLNRELNAAAARKYYESTGHWALPLGETFDAQRMWLFPGVRLIGAANGKGVINGLLYEVLSAGRDLRLKTLDTEELLTLPLEAVRNLRLAYALCVYTTQSLTLPGTVRLYAYEKHFGRRHLLVGMSRVKHASLLQVL